MGHRGRPSGRPAGPTLQGSSRRASTRRNSACSHQLRRAAPPLRGPLQERQQQAQQLGLERRTYSLPCIRLSRWDRAAPLLPCQMRWASRCRCCQRGTSSSRIQLVCQASPHQPGAPARRPGKTRGSRRDGLLPAIPVSGRPLVMAHHRDVKLRSVAADKVVLPHRREAGQETPASPSRAALRVPASRSSPGQGDFQTLADKWHNTSNRIVLHKKAERLTVKPPDITLSYPTKPLVFTNPVNINELLRDFRNKPPIASS